MSAAQPSNRLRLWMLIGVMLLLALGAVWLNQVLQRATGDFIPNLPRSEPDFYVEKFSYIRASRDGSARYHVSGERLTHNPQDDSYDITQPIVSSLGSGQGPATIRADKAKMENESRKIHLFDNVQMNRPATPKSEKMQFRTEYLVILPDDDIMQTDKAVDLTVGQSRLSGIGMFANNATREYRLARDVRGIYQMPAR